MRARKLQGLINVAPEMQAAIEALEDMNNANVALAIAINRAPFQELELNLFFKALPAPPNPLTGADFAAALDAGLGLEGPGSISALYTQNPSPAANVINAITDNPVNTDTCGKFRAMRGLYDLITGENLSEPTRNLLLALTRRRTIANVINDAPHEINLDDFYQALPHRTNQPLNGDELAAALDAGLGIVGNGIAELYLRNLAFEQDPIDAITGNPATNLRLRALRTIENLLRDHRILNPEFFIELALDDEFAAVIVAAPEEFNVARFIERLPAPPTAPDADAIAVALDAAWGIPPGQHSIAGVHDNAFGADAIDDIANDPATIQKLRAARALKNLMQPSFNFDGFQPVLNELIHHEQIATAIIGAGREINANAFIAALPLPGPLDGAAIAAALDAGLGIAGGGPPNSVTALYRDNVINVRNTIDPAVANAGTDEKLRALRLLSNLLSDVKFRGVRAHLYALVNHDQIRTAILTGREINVADFIGALPFPPAVIDGANIAAALDAGLGLEAPNSITNVCAINVNARNFITPITADPNTILKLQAARALKNLCTDNRIPNPQLFLALALDDDIAAAIVTATHELNVARFIETLPAPPAVPDADAIAAALDEALGIPPGANNIAGVHGRAMNDALDVIAADALTLQRLQASRALKKLLQPHFNFDGLQPALNQMICHPQIADAIIGAHRAINANAFIAALPLPPAVLNGAHIAAALDAGLGMGAAANNIAMLYDNNALNVQVTIDPAVADAATKEKLQALRVLSNLLNDVKFNNVHAELYALVQHDQIRNAIARARAINVADFVAALPPPPTVPNGAHIAAALDAGLGIAAIANLHATDVNARNTINPVVDADPNTTQKLQMSRALNNLMQDPRFANPNVQAAINELFRDRYAHIRNAIIASGREIDANLFISALPLPPVALTGRAIATALDTGFGIALGANSITQAYVANVPAGINAALNQVSAAAVADVPTTRLLQASRKLSNLMIDPRFHHADAQRALKVLIANQHIADAIIAAPHEIDVNRFIGAMPVPPATLNGAAIAVALDAGLQIPAAGNLIATLYRNHAHNEWAAINPVVANAETKRKLQASRVLQNLMVHPRFAEINVQTALKALVENEQIANAIIAAGREIDMTRFVNALPGAGAEIDSHAIAVALDAGLQTNNALTTLHDGGLQAPFNNVKDAHPETTRTLRALRALNNLMTDPRFADPAVKDALIALAGNQHIADTIIREGRDIDVTAFIDVLHNAAAVNGAAIADALDAGFQLVAVHPFADFYARNLHGIPPLLDRISAATTPAVLNLATLTSESELKQALGAQGIPEPENTALRQMLTDNRAREFKAIPNNEYKTNQGLQHRETQAERFVTEKYERFLSTASTELERATNSLHPKIDEIKKIDRSVNKLKADLLIYRKILADLKADVDLVGGGALLPGDAAYQLFLADANLDAANFKRDCDVRIAQINAYLLRVDQVIDSANDILLNPTRAAQNIAYGTKSTLGTAQEFTSYDKAAAAKNAMLGANAVPVVQLGVNANQLKTTERTNTVVAIPINIDVGNENLKTATIRTINESKQSVKSEIFFSAGVLKKIEGEKRIKQSTGYFSSVSTPGIGASEWAFQNIQTLMPALKENHPPISVAVGSGVPKVCIEALVVYCKFKFKKDINEILNLPHDYKDTVTQEQVNLFAREWKKTHPEDLSENELENEEREILELAAGIPFRP